MPILVMCTNRSCGELFDAPDSAAGGEVRCPACGTAQILATAGGEPAAKEPAVSPPPSPAAPTKPAVDLEPIEPASGLAPQPAAPSTKGLRSSPPAGKDGDDLGLELLGPAPAPVTAAQTAPAAAAAPSASTAPTASRLPTPSTSSTPAKAPAGARPAGTARDPVAAEEVVLKTPLTEAGAKRFGAAKPKSTAGNPPAATTAPPEAGFAEVGRSHLRDIRLEGPPPASLDAQLEESIWVAPPADETTSDADAASAADQNVLGYKPAVVLVLALGLLGMAAGLFAGVRLFPDQELLAAYLGAGVGWMAGFSFGALMVLAAEQSGGRVRCPVCRTEYPGQTEECGVCGCQSLAPAPDPLAIECLYAGSFGLSNPAGFLPPAALGMLATILLATTLEVIRVSPKEAAQWTPLLIGLSVPVCYLAFSYWMALLFSACDAPGRGVNLPPKAPSAPRLRSLETIASGLWALSAVAVYVVPLVTIPLLPVALLMLSTPGRKRALNPLAAARAVWARPRGFVVLWIFLMMWVAGAALAGVVVKMLYDLRLAIPPIAGAAGSILNVLLTGFGAGVFGIVLSIFGLAMFRCLAAFGRYSPGVLPPVSERSRRG